MYKLAALLFLALAACASSEQQGDVESAQADNSALRELYEQDQADRSDDSIDWRQVSRRDSLRRVRVRELLDANQVATSEDYRHAAMVFQHGSDTTAAWLAFDLAERAVELDSSNADAKWLMAAAWDRYQMRRGEPQWYGTQFVKDPPDSPWRLYDIDTTKVSDEDRRRLGVRSLAEARAHVASMNAP